ncbi:MAG: hypothetical protein RL653_4231 [Pseudomonadota bacterium]|jgi:hypothetical protein
MNVDRKLFTQALNAGVDLRKPGLAAELTRAGVPLERLASADLDGDGVLRGKWELWRAFNVVDGFDLGGPAGAFRRGGKAGAVFEALLRTVPKGKYADRIVSAAGQRIAAHGRSYALDGAPTSPHPLLTGNKVPGQTPLNWLKGYWKCNQFVGDVLTQAGVKAPLVKMWDGSYHYAAAEQWPARTDLFDRVTDPTQLQVGDVLVKDYDGSGDATAHVEIVTSLAPFSTAGAHGAGAWVETGRPNWLDGTRYDASRRGFASDGATVYILRPR